jgi:hypothetical protein
LRHCLTVGELSHDELQRRLTQNGLRIRVGPVVAEIRSTFELVHRGIAFHYAAHDLVPQEQFADFHIGVAKPARSGG